MTELKPHINKFTETGIHRDSNLESLAYSGLPIESTLSPLIRSQNSNSQPLKGMA